MKNAMTLDDMIRELEESAAVYDAKAAARVYWDDRITCLRAVKAIIDKLPHDENGNVILPGDTVHLMTGLKTAKFRQYREVQVESITDGHVMFEGGDVWPADECQLVKRAAAPVKGGAI